MNKLTIIYPNTKNPVSCDIHALIEHSAGSEFLFTYDDDYAVTKAVHEPVVEVLVYESAKGLEGEIFSIYWTQSSGWGIGDFQRLPVEVSQINYSYSLSKINYGAWEYPELTNDNQRRFVADYHIFLD